MSQQVFDTIVPSTTSGTQLAVILEAFKDAMMSGLSGDARPDQLQAGGAWIDTSLEDAPNYIWSYKVFTGTVDITIFKINLASSSLVLTGSDSEFSVKKVSDDTVAAVMKLIKNRVSGTGAATANNDVLGELQFIGRTNLGVDTVMARIRSVATQATTSTGSGSNLIFESTTSGETALSEVMRLVDGRLGLGVTAPSAEIHTRGAQGVRFESYRDDANPTRVKIRKRRISGTGATQNADAFAAVDFVTSDDVGGEGIAAQVLSTATQAHTSTAQGTKLSLRVVKTGETALTEQFSVGDVVEAIARLDINSLRLVSQDVATTATIAQLSASKAIVNMTGSTATAIQGINSGGATKVIVIHNGSSATVTLNHNDAGAAAADRMKFANSDNVELLPNSSVELFYSSTDSCWKIKSGSGSGGGAMRVTAVQTLAAGGSINSSITDQRQMRHVQGTSGQTAISTTAPFGSTGGWKDGTEMLLVGNSSANSVVLTYSDTSKGIVGNFDTWELGQYQTAMLVWSASLDRWILRGA